MENVIEYFESQEDALEFAKCLDCANYLVEHNIVKMKDVESELYNKFFEYTNQTISDTLMRRELFLSVVFKKE